MHIIKYGDVSLKIYVYAICKNEEKFVKRWYESVSEADGVYVLDTGSDDNTVKILKELGVNVKREIISPWRFDIARNKSLDMVPKDADVCICLDLDEVIEKGFREKIEKVWKSDTTRMSYTYNWKIVGDIPTVSFYLDKIHRREGYRWVHPVHEVLSYEGKENRVFDESLIINHYPDEGKSRSSYLPLLELSVKEDPFDDRNMHYLGREYMYYGRYNDAIDTLYRHLNLKSSTWKDERAASMRFIGRCYRNLKRPLESEMWYKMAIKEAPHLKEGYAEEGILLFEMGKYKEAKDLFLKALQIKKGYKSYITEFFTTDFYLYDVLSVCDYYLEDYNSALKYVNKALEIKEDKRINNNKKLIMDKL